MGTASDQVKPSFVIFNIRALWRSGLSVTVRQSARMSKITNDGGLTGQTQDALSLYPHGNSGREGVFSILYITE